MQFHFKNLVFLFLLFTLCFLLLPNSLVHAQSNTGSTPTDVTQAQYTLLTPLPELNGNCPSGSTCNANGTSNSINSIDLSQFISYAYKFMLALAVVLAVFMITVGGFEYMLSGAANTKSDALKKIQDAVWGLLLALVAYLLLYTIDPNLVSTSNLCIPPIGQTTCSSGGGLATTGGTTPASGLNGTVQLQQQQDQLASSSLSEAASDETQAQQLQDLADQLYNINGCTPYDQGGGGNPVDMSSSAPVECQHAQILYNQADNLRSQALTVSQQGFDSQAVSSVQQALLVNPAVVPCSNGPALGASQCYQGYQLNPQAQAKIQQQLTNIQNDKTSFTQKMSQINNGNQSSVITESQTAANQIETQIQTAIAQGRVAAQTGGGFVGGGGSGGTGTGGSW
jgi:hypothetical protein